MPQKAWRLPGPQVAPVNKCGCAEMSADSLFVNGRIDLNCAAQRLQNHKRLADLCRGLARLQIDDETQPDTGRTGKFVLPQACGLAGGRDNLADPGWGGGA